jgi:hypothetical protein
MNPSVARTRIEIALPRMRPEETNDHGSSAGPSRSSSPGSGRNVARPPVDGTVANRRGSGFASSRATVRYGHGPGSALGLIGKLRAVMIGNLPGGRGDVTGSM